MQVKARLNNLRTAPRKIRLVTDLIKGLDVKEALDQLDFAIKRGSLPVKKLLQSAIANGENNLGIDKDNMYVFNIIVGAGTTLKRWMPKAYGRAGQIRKRTSKIELILEERVEGKGRKSKEEIEKEKQKRMEASAAKAKAEKSAKGGSASGGEAKEEKEKSEVKVKTVENKEPGKKAEKKGGITSRIFRRKSM